MIVVDTNIIGYLFLTGHRAMQVERVLQKDPQWAAPLLWRSELRNVLAQYLRRHDLPLEDAQRIMEETARLMQGREFAVVSFQVLNLVAASTCSAFDCEFVALARELEVPLVTVDRQVLSQFPSVAVSLDAFAGSLD
jgi:predicted nucleic acid-binding protein